MELSSQNNKYSFENFIMQCCKSREWNLRDFLKTKLIENGFRIIEDNYQSRRVNKNKNYTKVRNLLAIRGKPEVCLVAHTDVCRDHAYGTPTIKPTIKEKNGRKIIQDENCEYQVGGDDRLGVAINTWIALNTGYDMALLFTTDEEVGLISADKVSFPELKEYKLLVQVDRGNHSNQLVNSICGTQLCSYETLNKLLGIVSSLGMPRSRVNGLPTDVMCIVENFGMNNIEAVNMTCGYHNSAGAQANEYIDVREARDTMKFVSAIIQAYDLEAVSVEPHKFS